MGTARRGGAAPKPSLSRSPTSDATGSVSTAPAITDVAVQSATKADVRESAHVRGASPVVSDFSAKTTASPKKPFVVPFYRSNRFLGRDDDLERLHALLQKDTTVGVGAVTGMGGIGKTQLTVEYAYRYCEAYPGGVYWVTATKDWQEELARLAGNVGIRDQSPSEYERLRWLAQAFITYLEEHPGALVIFDNVEDPLELQNASREIVPAHLPCRLLFTSRRQTDTSSRLEIRTLDDASALRLLLDTPARKHILGSGAADETTARSICKTLGNLPLALAVTSAYLEKRPKVLLRAYLDGLIQEGALLVVDESKLDPRELPTQHETGLRATFQVDWAAIDHEGHAPSVLQTAALLGEAEAIPRARLSLLTGLSDVHTTWRDPPLDEALRELSSWSLLEELSENTIRLHPLVREFALWKLDTARQTFPAACAERMANALDDIGRLSAAVEARGIDEVLADLRVGIDLGGQTERKRLDTLLRPLDREAHTLRRWDPAKQPVFFLQQLRNRCFEMGIDKVWRAAEQKLLQHNWSWLAERFALESESDALVRTLVGHKQTVRTLCLAPNNNEIWSASWDGTSKLWDINTGRAIRTFLTHGGPFLEGHICTTADGKLAISESIDKSIKVWDTVTGEVYQLLKDDANLSSLTTIPQSTLFVSTYHDGAIKIWNFETGLLVRKLETNQVPIFDAVLTRDGRYLITAMKDNTVLLLNLENGEIVRTFVGHTQSVMTVAVTPNGRCIVSGSGDHKLIMWDIATGDVLCTLTGHVDCIRDVAIDPTGQIAVSASNDHTVMVWDLATGQCICTFFGHSKRVTSVAISRDGQFAISASDDDTIKVWALSAAEKCKSRHQIRRHDGRVTRTAITHDGCFGLSIADDKCLKVSDLKTGDEIRIVDKNASAFSTLMVLPDGTSVTAESDPATLHIWNIQNGQLLKTIERQAVPGRVMAMASDGSIAASAAENHEILIWSVGTGERISVLKGHTDDIYCVAISTTGDVIISGAFGNNDRTVRLWDIRSGKLRRIWIPDSTASLITISPDGKLAALVTTSLAEIRSELILVVCIETGQCIHRIVAHEKQICEIVVTFDNQYIISTSADCTLCIWHLESGSLVAKLEGSAPLWGCAVSPDGKTILAGDRLGSLHILDWHHPANWKPPTRQ